MATTPAADIDPDFASATPRAGQGKPVGAGTLRCVVVTPERTLFDQPVDFVALPLYDGELGVLPGRAPLIGRLGFGALRTRHGGVTTATYIDGGFAQVRDDVVTVLTSRAIPADRIDLPTASSELATARALVATGDTAQAEKQRSVDRARAMLRVAEARR